MFSRSGEPSARIAGLGAALAVAALAAALLAAPASAAPPCPKEKVCTDEKGFYTLNVPPLPNIEPYAAYRDCVWHVHVNFGDGTSADYIFEGEKGLSGSHTFPHYGEYAVKITLSESHHKSNPTGPECLNPPQSATVLYRDPSKFAEEEARETKIKAEQEQKEREAREAREAARAQREHEAAQEQQELEERQAKARAEREKKQAESGSEGGTGGESGGGGQAAYWASCRHRVLAHRVGCGKAQSVAKAAGKKLTGRGSAKVAGYSCSYAPSRPRPLSCRRGGSRVLGPPA